MPPAGAPNYQRPFLRGLPWASMSIARVRAWARRARVGTRPTPDTGSASPPASRDRASDDAWTIAAAGALGYVAADVAHHVLGHAAACGLFGGRVRFVSAIYVACTVRGAPVDLAGPAANLAVGAAAWAASRGPRPSPAVRLTLLLAAAFNLFWLEGQLVFNAATRGDDWGELLRTVRYPRAWQVALVGVGATAYLQTVRAVGTALRRLAGATAGTPAGSPAPRVRRLRLIAYGAAGLTAGLTGLRDPGGLATLVSNGAPQALVLPLGLLLVREGAGPAAGAAVRRSGALLALAVAAVGASVALLGPGIHVPPRP